LFHVTAAIFTGSDIPTVAAIHFSVAWLELEWNAWNVPRTPSSDPFKNCSNAIYFSRVKCANKCNMRLRLN